MTANPPFRLSDEARELRDLPVNGSIIWRGDIHNGRQLICWTGKKLNRKFTTRMTTSGLRVKRLK